jgi:hypothetical protein
MKARGEAPGTVNMDQLSLERFAHRIGCGIPPFLSAPPNLRVSNSGPARAGFLPQFVLVVKYQQLRTFEGNAIDPTATERSSMNCSITLSTARL